VCGGKIERHASPCFVISMDPTRMSLFWPFFSHSLFSIGKVPFGLSDGWAGQVMYENPSKVSTSLLLCVHPLAHSKDAFCVHDMRRADHEARLESQVLWAASGCDHELCHSQIPLRGRGDLVQICKRKGSLDFWRPKPFMISLEVQTSTAKAPLYL